MNKKIKIAAKMHAERILGKTEFNRNKVAAKSIAEDFKAGAEWHREQEEFALIEYTTDKNMEVISSFVKFYESESGNNIDKDIIINFFE